MSSEMSSVNISLQWQVASLLAAISNQHFAAAKVRLSLGSSPRQNVLHTRGEWSQISKSDNIFFIAFPRMLPSYTESDLKKVCEYAGIFVWQ